MTTVLVTDKVNASGLHPLNEDDSYSVVSIDDSAGEEFFAALDRAHALIVRSATTVSRDLISRAPVLKAIGRAGVGVDNVDIPAASERGIAVFNAPGGNTLAAAELTVGLILSLARRIPQADASLRSGRWDRAEFKGVELAGKTLGLIGAGRIGSEVAVRCRAFAMDVLVYDPYLDADRAGELGADLVGLDVVLERADFISIHVPLSDETRGIVGSDALAAMKPTAFLVNASRGGVVDEEAVAAALVDSVIAGAALDVYEKEPLASDSPLRDAPNMVLTPHLGASTAEAQEGVATEVAEKIKTMFDTGDVSSAVNASDLA